ncbi:tryptophan--tRNA ligase, mitochondrial [Battus philenor]|uniref:tryptophan--tRNA ligase, mitochondrial n=1 Tax=Battus philenor TaxID=42288 RepID=UPI0035D01E41
MVVFRLFHSNPLASALTMAVRRAFSRKHIRHYGKNPNRGFCGKPEPAEGWPRRVVSGLQPTGELHVGNYFGALRRCVQLQQAGDDVMLFIADLHSFTSHQRAGELQAHTLQLAAVALAAGLQPERGALFVQSAVARHAELCWLLACLATQARLAHLPQYKEKASTMKEVPVGLLLYPVLQAADILVYRGTHVPVGADQLQHLQVAAQLVRTFRHRYGDAFPTPRALLAEDGSDKIRSLRDPNKKMSKSDPDPKSRILLIDSDDTIRHKIRKAVTDFTPQVTFDPENRPGVSNLVNLHCLASGLLPEEAVEEAEGLTTAQYKGVVAEALCAALGPVRERAAELRARPDFLRDVLQHGATRARARADAVYNCVAELTGLTSPAALRPERSGILR